MAKIWYNRILAGTKKYSACPTKYKSAVKALLEEAVLNGELSSDDYNTLIEA